MTECKLKEEAAFRTPEEASVSRSTAYYRRDANERD